MSIDLTAERPTEDTTAISVAMADALLSYASTHPSRLNGDAAFDLVLQCESTDRRSSYMFRHSVHGRSFC